MLVYVATRNTQTLVLSSKQNTETTSLMSYVCSGSFSLTFCSFPHLEKLLTLVYYLPSKGLTSNNNINKKTKTRSKDWRGVIYAGKR